MYFLPKATPEGYRVLMMRVGPDLKPFNHQQKITRTLMMIELAMVTWPDMAGMIICYDMKYAPVNLINRLSLTTSGVAPPWAHVSLLRFIQVTMVILDIYLYIYFSISECYSNEGEKGTVHQRSVIY